jgi:hypothetical protein
MHLPKQHPFGGVYAVRESSFEDEQHLLKENISLKSMLLAACEDSAGAGLATLLSRPTMSN